MVVDAVGDEWARFAQCLRSVLRDLDERSYLVVTWSRGRATVQFRQGDDLLYAEATGDEFVPDDRHLSVEQVGSMHAAGWLPPTVDPAGMSNWHRELPWPSTTAQYDQLAQSCVIALRLRGVGSPSELTYRAWRDPERPAPGATVYPGDVDEGDPRLELPQLGLAHAS